MVRHQIVNNVYIKVSPSNREACEEEETMGTTTLRGEDLFDDTSEADEHYELAPEDPAGGSSDRPGAILNKGRISCNFSSFSHWN